MILTSLNDLSLIVQRTPETTTASTVSRLEVASHVHSGILSTPHHTMLNLTHTEHLDPTTDDRGTITTAEVLDGAPELGGLVNRARTGVRTTASGTAWVELTSSHIDGPGARPRNCNPPLAKLDVRCGGDVAGFLLSKGVLRVGTRQQLFGEDNRRRNNPAAEVSSPAATEALLWCFAVARVLPLIRQIESGVS